jgi:uncharacterized membrane protein
MAPSSQESGGDLDRLLDRNIAALIARRRAHERRQPAQDRMAVAIARFAGSMPFVWLHIAVVGAWLAVNLGLVPGPRFDPDLVRLATATSVEAIFLTTFVLLTQNRMVAVADRRADLDVQIGLLSEHEVTRLIRLVTAMARRMGIDEAHEAGIGDLARDVAPDEVLDRIQDAEDRNEPSPH